jgi:hypothetical protein
MEPELDALWPELNYPAAVSVAKNSHHLSKLEKKKANTKSTSLGASCFAKFLF